MFNWSNFDILQLLQQEPGRLREFLLEVPLDDLEAVVEQKQLSADRQYRQSRSQFAYKKNVLDMTLEEVISHCNYQNIIDFLIINLPFAQRRIQNHPLYGYKLINRFPEKYYLGERSGHYNHAKQIEKAYGIFRGDNNEDDESSSNQDANEPEQGGDDSQDNEIGEQEEYDYIYEISSDLNNGKEDDQNSGNENSEDNFIVSDQDFEEDELTEDSVEEQIGNRKNARSARKQSYSEEKFESTQEKYEISEITIQRKLSEPVQETLQKIYLEEEYLIEPQQLSFTVLQTERSKRNQKKIKQEQKRLQCSFSANPSNGSAEFIAEKEDAPFVAPRKGRKMNLELDD